MLAVVDKEERNDLFLEIFNAYRQWPELERKIFSLAHYRGQSPEVISRALRLDEGEVSEILSACNARLQESLKSYLKKSYDRDPLAPNGTVRPVSLRQEQIEIDAPAPRPFDLTAPRRIPA